MAVEEARGMSSIIGLATPRRTIVRGVAVLFVVLSMWTLQAQTPRPIPRPPAQVPGAPPAGSAAPDGYAPIPEWAGQTKAPRVAVSLPYDVEMVATGINVGYSIDFLPDGRILLVERPGRLRIIDRAGQV